MEQKRFLDIPGPQVLFLFIEPEGSSALVHETGVAVIKARRGWQEYNTEAKFTYFYCMYIIVYHIYIYIYIYT